MGKIKSYVNAKGVTITKEYNDDNKIIHYIDSTGVEECYNDDGRCYRKTATGIERWYDNNGRIVKTKTSKGIYTIYVYENDKLVYRGTSDGDKDYYDPNGNIIYDKYVEYTRDGGIAYSLSFDGIEEVNEFDINCNSIHYTESHITYDKNGVKYSTILLEIWRVYENNNLIHRYDNKGYKEWYEYDNNNNQIHYRDTDGYEYWREYDEFGHLIHYRNATGYEEWKEYDEFGNVIYHRNNNGCEKWYEYNSLGIVIHYRDTDGYEERYDDKGQLIFIKLNDKYTYYYPNEDVVRYKPDLSYKYTNQYKYDPTKVRYENDKGHETWYDEYGNIIRWKARTGEAGEYHFNGKSAYYRSVTGRETWKDISGRITHIKDPDGIESWSEYNDDEYYVRYHTSDGLDYKFNLYGDIID